MKGISGIYAIVNMKSGNRYIGRAVDLNKRKQMHFWQLRKNIHGNKALQSAYNKGDPLVFTIIEQCKREKLNEREVYWINQYNTLKDGYNLCEGGGTTTGYKFTDEQRKKISEAQKGRKQKREDVERRNATLRRRREMDPEFDERLREAHRRNLAKARGKLKGRPMPEKQKRILSERLKGRYISPEHKEKLRTLYSGEGSKSNKLKSEQVIDIRIRAIKKEPYNHILSDYPIITKATICDIYKGRRWKCLPMDIETLEKLKKEEKDNGTEIHTI